MTLRFGMQPYLPLGCCGKLYNMAAVDNMYLKASSVESQNVAD